MKLNKNGIVLEQECTKKHAVNLQCTCMTTYSIRLGARGQLFTKTSSIYVQG